MQIIMYRKSKRNKSEGRGNKQRPRPQNGGRNIFCRIALLIVILLMIGANGMYANRVTTYAALNGGTVLQPGSVTNISSFTDADFPLRIEANGTYTIVGNYSGDYGEPLGYRGEQLSTYQSAERREPWTHQPGNGLISVGSNKHGIYVAPALKNVTVILRNVGIMTTGGTSGSLTTTPGWAAFIIDGADAVWWNSSNAGAPTYQGHADGSNVVVQLEGRNMLYSGRVVNSSRAGLEVWKGSTVFIEGNGSLLAKSSVTRNFSLNVGTYPRAATHEHPQGSPYWDTSGDGSTHEDTRSTASGGYSGAAGIGSGDVSGSGGNVVIRANAAGSPRVIAIAGAHGAGIGGAWNSTNGGGRYDSDVLITAGTVESWGGEHGAGIGGGCGNANNTNSVGSVVVLPTASVYSASYGTARPMLGQVGYVVYFGNTEDSRLAVYTEDFRQVPMFLDMSKNEQVRSVIDRLGGGINPSNLPLGTTRNDWPANGASPNPVNSGQHRPNYAEWAAGTLPAFTGQNVLLLNGGFVPRNVDVAFLTGAKTEKNQPYSPVSVKVLNPAAINQGYALSSLTETYKTYTFGLEYPTDDFNAGAPTAMHYANVPAGSLKPVPRFVMTVPTFVPQVSLTPAPPVRPQLYVGYSATDPDNKITLTIGNAGNQKLYNPIITIKADDYELIGTPGDLQDVINAALAPPLLSTDADGDYIAPGASFNLELKLIDGKTPGTSYNGWVQFNADKLPDGAQLFQFNIDVLDKILPPPDLSMESPVDTVISGPYQIRAKFKSPAGVYPHYVTNLQPSDVFVDFGTVTAVNPVAATQNPSNPGFYSDWILDITPNPSLPNKTLISNAVKQGAATDLIGAHTQTVSQPKYVTYSSTGPTVTFSIAEGATVPSLDTLLIYFNGNDITPGKADSIYTVAPQQQFTAPGVEAYLQTSVFTLERLLPLPVTTLDITTIYPLLVTDENNLKIGSPPPVGFPNGTYRLTIAPNLIRNYVGNQLGQVILNFSVQMPTVADGDVSISPATLPVAGGTARILVEGLNLSAAKGLLEIEFLNDVPPGYTTGDRVIIPSAQFTDTTAWLDVLLPPNMTAATQNYSFRVWLTGRLPLENITPDLTTQVLAATALIDTTQIQLGYWEGIKATPNLQTYEGGPVDLKLIGENLSLLNTAPYSNLRIRVLKNGAYTSTAIPVATPFVIGPQVISLGNAFTTAQNLKVTSDVYRFELWYDNNGTPTPVPESSTGLPYVSDSTVVPSGFDDLIAELRATHHVVSQLVANTRSEVRTWLVPRLNALEILHRFGLTVEESDITLTAFSEASAGMPYDPSGTDGSFVFTLRLRTSPELLVTLNTGEIRAIPYSAPVIERSVTMPETPGFVTDPPVGEHFIESGNDFSFYLVPTPGQDVSTKPKVTTNRRLIPDNDNSIIVEEMEDGAYYRVTIREVREPFQIYINEDDPDANAEIDATKVWGDKGLLHIYAATPGSAQIYSADGRLQATRTLEAREAVSTPLAAGVYVVTLDGETYKVIVK
jgi:hypothetical protein